MPPRFMTLHVREVGCSFSQLLTTKPTEPAEEQLMGLAFPGTHFGKQPYHTANQIDSNAPSTTWNLKFYVTIRNVLK